MNQLQSIKILQKYILFTVILILVLGVVSASDVFADVPNVSLDDDVYPIPFGNIHDFDEDIASSHVEGRSIFPLHQSAIDSGNLQVSDTITDGDLVLHIRIFDDSFNVSSDIDKIAQDINGKTVGPLKISLSRNSESMTLAYAGGSTPNENGLIDVGDNNPNHTRQLGAIDEIAPDAGIFDLDFVVRYTDGPSNPDCPDTVTFVSLNPDIIPGTEESRFDEQSNKQENYCILKGDMLTLEYTQLDTSGNVIETFTDYATFDLRDGMLKSDKVTYSIGNDMILTIIEPDLNLDNDVYESYDLDLIEWDSDAATLTLGFTGGEIESFDPEPMSFRETGDSTGIFQTIIEIPQSLLDDPLERGEEIILEYTDWSPASAQYVGQEGVDSTWTIHTSDFGASIELDKVTYTLNDEVQITITAKDHNFDIHLIDEIGNDSFYPVMISAGDYSLRDYKLVETGLDTGIFTGKITLGKAQSDEFILTNKGPLDGVLPIEDNSKEIVVSFEYSEDVVVYGSALIQSSIESIEILSPLKQIKNGISLDDVKCKLHLQKMIKHNGIPVCVTPETKIILVERGWQAIL